MQKGNQKLDINQLVGFILIGALMMGFLFFQNKNRQALAKEEFIQDSIAKIRENSTEQNAINLTDLQATVESDSLGKEAISAQTFFLENDKIKIGISNLGGQISSVHLKGYDSYKGRDSLKNVIKQDLYLIKENNHTFGFKTGNVETKNLSFSGTQNGDNVTLKTSLPQGGTLTYNYKLFDDYSVSFDSKAEGESNTAASLDWKLDAFQLEKGRKFEETSTKLFLSIDNHADIDNANKKFSEEQNLDWVSFKQQFFTSVLENKTSKFSNANAKSQNLASSHSKYIKQFSFDSKVQSLDQEFNFHFFPLDYNYLKKNYKEKKFHKQVALGWGIFGLLNKWVFLPLFKMISSTGMAYGIVILLLTIVVKLITSPIMYKQHKQSAMMRVLRPEIDEISKKFPKKEDAMKKQQATMELYKKTGVNMFAGCLPALLQIPIFYALFNFFPNILDLRGKPFLWAEDLTAYESIFYFPGDFSIPMFGDHISLFALLYAIALLIYTRMTSSNMQTPTQEGMPDMKTLMYFMPLIFVVFLNSYASGLSWYYLVSNVINIGLVLAIKTFLIDEDKILAQLQENKKKPQKKQSKFQARLQDAMKQAEAQQKARKK